MSGPRWPDDFAPGIVERARALVRPQPPPKDADGEPIWQIVIAEQAEAMPRIALALMHARDEFGREKYGKPLRLDDGRDHGPDVLQEALDFVVYAKAKVLKEDCGPLGPRWRLIYAKAVDFFLEIALALEVEGL